MSASGAIVWIVAVPLIVIIVLAKCYCKKERRNREIDQGIRRYQEQMAATATISRGTNNNTGRTLPRQQPAIFTIESDNRTANSGTIDVPGRNLPYVPRLSIISNNGLPPSYEEAIKMEPIYKVDNNGTNQT